jgi:hypothetical protein
MIIYNKMLSRLRGNAKILLFVFRPKEKGILPKLGGPFLVLKARGIRLIELYLKHLNMSNI